MPEAISSVAITTRDRPEILERALRSHLENARNHDRDVAFLVLDDSSSQAARLASRERLGVLKRELAATIFYAGREEKEHFASLLAGHTTVPSDVIDFALFGDPEDVTSTTRRAANRNALLLETAGTFLFAVDDDTDGLVQHELVLDNRELLPPFVPAGRAQDLVFGRMLTRLEAPRSGHVPFVLPVAPGEIEGSAGGDELGLIIAEGIASCPLVPGEGDVFSRLGALGAHLVSMGSAAPRERLVLEFGRLVCAWPELVARTRQLRLEGQRLAEAL